MNNYIIEILAAWMLLIYVFGYQFKLKKLIGIKNSFVRIKPFDCYFCMNFWSQIIFQAICFHGWENAIHAVSCQLICAALIQVTIEGDLK